MSRWPLIGIALVALLATACEQKKETPTAHKEDTAQPLSTLDKPVETDPYANEPVGGPARGPMAEGNSLPPAGNAKSDAIPSGARTHIVQKGDTLSKLARQYYHDQSKWKKIYDANRSRIKNKDRLEVGQKLIIP
jgi:nucleoid-associated protein YgaU